MNERDEGAAPAAVILAPLGVEAMALRGPGRTVVRSGMGGERARRFVPASVELVNCS